MATPEEVQVALRVLRAGVPGEHPSIDADTVALWAGQLAGWPASTLVEAAKQWAEDEPKFPSLLAFTKAVQTTARRIAAQRAAIERPAGWVGEGDLNLARCKQCGGSDWLEVPDEKRPGNVYMRPCSLCLPVLYERWRAGHMDPEHDRFACHDELCRKTHGKHRV